MHSTAKQLARIGLSVGLLGAGSYYSVLFLEERLSRIIIESTVEALRDPEVQEEVYELFVSLLSRLLSDEVTYEKAVEFLIKILQDHKFEEALATTLIELLNASESHSEGLHVMRYILQSMLYELNAKERVVQTISLSELKPKKFTESRFKVPLYNAYRLSGLRWENSFNDLSKLVLMREAEEMLKLWLRTKPVKWFVAEVPHTKFPECKVYPGLQRTVDFLRLMSYRPPQSGGFHKIALPEPSMPSSKLPLAAMSLLSLRTHVFELPFPQLPKTVPTPDFSAISSGFSLEALPEYLKSRPKTVSELPSQPLKLTTKLALPPKFELSLPEVQTLEEEETFALQHLTELPELTSQDLPMLLEPMEQVETHYIKY
jgi:hypothetical protein